MSRTIATTSATTPAVTCSVRLGSRMRAGTISASATMPQASVVGTITSGFVKPRRKKWLKNAKATPTSAASTTR